MRPQRSSPGVSVLVADVNRISCELVADALGRGRNNFTVTASVTSREQVLAAADKHEPHVVLLSVVLEDGPLAGFEVLRDLRSSHPKSRVIMVLDQCDRDQVTASFRGGARGVFCRAESVPALYKCIQAVHEGQIWANSEELQYVLEALSKSAPLRVVNSNGEILLTPREQEVAGLVAEGFKNSEISEHLSLSGHTVKNYIFHIFEKLGLSSRAELILYALHHRQKEEIPS